MTAGNALHACEEGIVALITLMLAAQSEKPEKIVRRNITLVPGNGAMVVLRKRDLRRVVM